MAAPSTSSHRARAARHAALGDETRLAIVDELALSDRSPAELRRSLDVPSNLLAHHLGVLEAVGLVVRTASSGDRRRRYVRLVHAAFDELAAPRRLGGRALFVCTRNSARSQLAAALWQEITGDPGDSAGTHPADAVHPQAVAAAARAGLDLAGARPRSLDDVADRPDVVVTVCDQAHEELTPPASWLHWSVADPVAIGGRAAFDRTVGDLRQRITTIAAAAARGER